MLKLELTAPCDGTGVIVTPGICVELTPCDVVEVGEDVAVGLGVVPVQPSTSTDAQIVNNKRITKIFRSIDSPSVSICYINWYLPKYK
jgi:hypothetical protein